MKMLAHVSAGIGGMAKRAVLILTMLGLVVSTFAPSAAAASASFVASADASGVQALGSPEGELRGAPLSDHEMAQVVGSGFWSSFWEGVKEATAWVIVAGLVYLVWDFCQNPQVSCALDE